MNFAMVLRSLGVLLVFESAAMFLPLLVSIIYGGNDVLSFLYTIIILIILGTLGLFVKPEEKSIYARDGFAVVALGWLMISFFGSLPFVFSGAVPSLVDAFFETCSGFTTTGASILTDIEALPRGLLFWRSFTHWVGGMGVLVLTLAILPSAGANTLLIMNAESPGPNPGKLVPKVGQTAKILYSIYAGITLIQIVLLVAAGMPAYDACIHAFGTVGTGGFSSKGASIAAYNNVVIEVIITIFTLICGVNFSLYYQALKGNIKTLFRDQEFRFYITVIVIAIILITFNIYNTNYTSMGESLRHSSFQVVTIITTTGYSTTDFDQWPTLSKIILFALMFFGGCAGSTSGSIKNVRIMLLLKIMRRDLMKIIHPRAVYSVRMNGKNVDEEVLSEVLIFFCMYMMIFAFSVLLISFDGKDVVTTVSSVAAALGNIGPGFAMVGPTGNFSGFSDFSKIILSFCMIIGRLEIYPILLLLVPSFWRKANI